MSLFIVKLKLTMVPFLSLSFFENKDQFLHDEVSSSVSQLATKVQGASFRGWKEVTSMFNKDDEQQLLAGCKSPKSKGYDSLDRAALLV
nr:PREDICTED: testis development-related protein isoform X3 [Struthio camelus australis]